jgi:hypothetical protein
MRARFYESQTGGFTTRDPMFSQTDQAYAYAGGDPVNASDPSGMNDSGTIDIIRTESVDLLRTECQQDPQAAVCGNCPSGVSGLECAIATYDPGYAAVAGFGTEIQEAESGCSFWTSFKYGLEGTAGLVGTGAVAGGAVEFGSGAIGDITAGSAAEGGLPELPVISLPSAAEAQEMVQSAEEVGSALKDDLYHNAAWWASDNIASDGSVFRIVGGDGQPDWLIQAPGEVNDISGRFEWIVNDQGELEHQYFVKGGSINGIPNTP